MNSLNEKSNKLIEEHYKRTSGLNYDGLINEEEYKKVKNRKIVFILKESWSKNIDENYSITKDINKWVCKNNKLFADNTSSKQMFDRLSEWSYGILNNCYDFDEVQNELNKLNTYHKPLCKVGYINISKEITTDSTTSYSKVKQYLEKNKNLIKQQIELFESDVIIACGVYGEYGIADAIYSLFDEKSEWFDGGANGSSIVDVNNKKVGLISSYHPAAIKIAKDKFNEIMTGWKNIQDKLNPPQ
jgi:hypothetical protein